MALKSVKMRSWNAVDRDWDDKPRYPSVYFNDTAADVMKPDVVDMGSEYMMVARVKLTGVEEHEGEGLDSVSYDILEAEIMKPSKSDDERAKAIFGEKA